MDIKIAQSNDYKYYVVENNLKRSPKSRPLRIHVLNQISREISAYK